MEGVLPGRADVCCAVGGLCKDGFRTVACEAGRVERMHYQPEEWVLASSKKELICHVKIAGFEKPQRCS